MDKMKFSVSMCVYGGDNSEHFEVALDSVINQTAVPDEIVLVVDGPVGEKTAEVIEKKRQEFDGLNVVALEKNVGHGEARRIGLEKCQYPLVAIMDADDICVCDRFEKQLKCFEEDDNLSIVGGNICEFIDSPENIVGRRNVPKSHDEIVEYMKTRCPFNQMTVMFRKRSVLNSGGYLDWYCDEDYYLWLRMFLNGCKFRNIDECLVDVRVGRDMYKRRGGLKYFKSEAKLQKFMLKSGIIGVPTYIINVVKRLIVQVLLPNWLRGWVFKKFARE